MTRTAATKIRQFFAHHWDAEKVRITRRGEVFVYGKLPNTNWTGWYFGGFSENILDQIEQNDL
jgi:hypothetical protein